VQTYKNSIKSQANSPIFSYIGVSIDIGEDVLKDLDKPIGVNAGSMVLEYLIS